MPIPIPPFNGAESPGWPVAEPEPEAESLDRAPSADKAMPEGTRICVAGRGRGTYVRFHRRGLGLGLLVANEHTIAFDSGETVALNLREEEWTVNEAEMLALPSTPPQNEAEPPPEAEPEADAAS